ncbi:hypothetical protein D1781_14705 [Amnibacterium setariae]|uniref:Uncharacterized protein n=1 Tax=Amnibacterium setariae TaxID=2306585 RepID=A0A3A1TYJ1_9MICO|nr:hypothetical protein D1781_14705 [Amnibacterium setariae]
MTLRKVDSDARASPSARLVLEDLDRALGFYYAGALGGSGATPTDLFAVSWFGRCVPVICGKSEPSAGSTWLRRSIQFGASGRIRDRLDGLQLWQPPGWQQHEVSLLAVHCVLAYGSHGDGLEVENRDRYRVEWNDRVYSLADFDG